LRVRKTPTERYKRLFEGAKSKIDRYNGLLQGVEGIL